MKQYIFLIVIMISSFSFSQDSTRIKNVETPIINKLYLGESIDVEQYRIEFVEVIQDSRCPKGVSCIWAGEVILLVDLYKEDKKVERKKITLSSKIEFRNKTGNLLSSETLSLSVFNLMPYPTANNKTKPNEYYLILDTKY